MVKNIFFRFVIGSFILINFLPARATAQPAALAELFCNVNCGNCPTPDAQYETYLSTHPGVVLINYHNIITDNKDPFYLASYPASQDRDVLYGGPNGQSQDPDASIDGVSAGTEESQWETYTNLSLEHPLPTNAITSSISQGPSGSGIDTIIFTITGSTSTPVVYYVAIKESKILFDNTGENYGNPPGDLWNDIFRTMLPNGNGSAAFNFAGTHQDTVIYDPTNYAYSGNEQNMTAVIIVQDKNSAPGTNNYQIEALDTIPFASQAGVSESTSPTDRLIISSNPLSSQGHIGFELASAANVQLVLSDLLGRQVRTLVDGMMPSGQTSVDMNGNTLPAGCYLARLIVDGRAADQAKFIVAP